MFLSPVSCRVVCRVLHHPSNVSLSMHFFLHLVSSVCTEPATANNLAQEFNWKLLSSLTGLTNKIGLEKPKKTISAWRKCCFSDGWQKADRWLFDQPHVFMLLFLLTADLIHFDWLSHSHHSPCTLTALLLILSTQLKLMQDCLVCFNSTSITLSNQKTTLQVARCVSWWQRFKVVFCPSKPEWLKLGANAMFKRGEKS